MLDETGVWYAEGHEMGKIVIDTEKCNGCEICIHICPHKLIRLSERMNVRGYHYTCFEDPEHHCAGDALCAEMCPQVAIKVYR
ncbi:MAG: ferredoxin family protein [Planctomycetota bacterium]